MFYLYPTTSGEGDIFGAFERCKENSTAPLSAQLEGGHFRNHSLHKHGDDLWFYDAVQTSKYRTYDPEQATLFVFSCVFYLMCSSDAKLKLCWRTGDGGRRNECVVYIKCLWRTRANKIRTANVLLPPLICPRYSWAFFRVG